MKKYLLFFFFIVPFTSFAYGTGTIIPSSGSSLLDGVLGGGDGSYRIYLTHTDPSSWDFSTWGGANGVGTHLSTEGCGYLDGNPDAYTLYYLYGQNGYVEANCPANTTTGVWYVIETDTGSNNTLYTNNFTIIGPPPPPPSPTTTPYYSAVNDDFSNLTAYRLEYMIAPFVQQLKDTIALLLAIYTSYWPVLVGGMVIIGGTIVIAKRGFKYLKH